MTAPIRGSDVFIAEDVRRLMRALAATHQAAAQVGGSQNAYQAGYSAGFVDGLRAMAEGLGIPFRPGDGNVAIGVRYDEW